MFRENDDKEWREPVAHAKKEVIQDCGEMISSGDGGNDVNNDASKRPQESRDFGSPITENLSGQAELKR
jgi:hypothetical protein